MNCISEAGREAEAEAEAEVEAEAVKAVRKSLRLIVESSDDNGMIAFRVHIIEHIRNV